MFRQKDKTNRNLGSKGADPRERSRIWRNSDSSKYRNDNVPSEHRCVFKKMKATPAARQLEWQTNSRFHFLENNDPAIFCSRAPPLLLVPRLTAFLRDVRTEGDKSEARVESTKPATWHTQPSGINAVERCDAISAAPRARPSRRHSSAATRRAGWPANVRGHAPRP